MKDRALTFFLALCMAVAMLPVIACAAPNTYAVTLTSSGPGRIELLADSPARAGAAIGFTADPDDGYLAEFHCEGLRADEILRFGGDSYGFLMPAGDVTLEVRFVPAAGDSCSITVQEAGSGSYTLSRTCARPGEGVRLTVVPADNLSFDPYYCLFSLGADLDYLYEDENGHHYELLMGTGDANICIAYSETYIARVSVEEALARTRQTVLSRLSGIGAQILYRLHLNETRTRCE